MAARRQVTRSVTVPAPPARVWEVLSGPGGLAGWLGPGAGERPVRLEAAGAAPFELWWCAPRDGAAGPGDLSVVRVVLEPEQGQPPGTRVTVTETALADHTGPLPEGLAVPQGAGDAAATGQARP